MPEECCNLKREGPKDHINIRILQSIISAIPPLIGPWNQHVRSLCSYYTIPCHHTIPYLEVPPYIGPWNQSVRSLRLYYTLPYHDTIPYLGIP